MRVVREVTSGCVLKDEHRGRSLRRGQRPRGMKEHDFLEVKIICCCCCWAAR